MRCANTRPVLGISSTGLGHVEHPLGEVVVRVERAAVHIRGPEQPAVLIELLEGERRRAQRDHLVESRPAA